VQAARHHLVSRSRRRLRSAPPHSSPVRCVCSASLGLLVACGPPERPPSVVPAAEQPAPARIVASERGRRGSHLVFIGEDGARLADLTADGEVVVVDSGAAWSPDGRFVVFESSRGRDALGQSSLWLVAARPGGRLRRLTSGAAVDRDPAWTPDGRAVVFASHRGSSFDLYRLDLEPDGDGLRERGAPTRLTDGPGHELHPSVSPTGAVVYTSADQASGSSLWLLEPGAAPRPLTRGPADLTPCFSPDGARIAFAAATEDEIAGEGGAARHIDQDLYLIEADGSGRRLVIDEPYSDQSGPRWSPDGRYLFATSLYRAVASHRAALTSITFVDLRERPPVVRALHDPAAVDTRFGPTLAPGTLESTLLHRNPGYGDALRDLARELERRRAEGDGGSE
jgi:Tol biopolymer transport system component